MDQVTDSYLRRTVLAATGLFLSGTAGAASDEKTDKSQNTTVKQRQNVRVTQEQTVKYDNKHGCTTCDPAEEGTRQLGTLAVYNHSHCQRKVTVGVTGRIALEGESLEDSTISIQVPPEQQCVAGFEGSIQRLDCEHGDLDIMIEQRSENEANHCDGENRIFRD